MALARLAWVMITALGLGAGCARGAPAAAAPPAPAAEAGSEQHGGKERTALPRDVVMRAAMPYVGVRVRDGVLLEPRAFAEELSDASVVCLGERHDNPHDHYAQLALVEQLLELAAMSGREVGVGFEMFQTPYQAPLTAWRNDEIDDDELLERTEWHDRWGFDFNLYRPLLSRARRSGATLLALNAPRELTRKISREGVEVLDEGERSQLPELDFDDAQHRQWFEGMMRHHPPGHGKGLGNLYAAQLTWDETMAHVGARWVAARLPMRQLIVIAGNGHCINFAVPSRVQRRGIERVVSVRAGFLQEGVDPGPALAGFDYGVLFVADGAR